MPTHLMESVESLTYYKTLTYRDKSTLCQGSISELTCEQCHQVLEKGHSKNLISL